MAGGSKSEKQQKVWQLQPVRNFYLFFFVAFVVGVGGSVGVAYGWSKALHHEVTGRRDFSFVGFIAALFIMALTIHSILYHRHRLMQFTQIIASFSALVDSVFYNLAEPPMTQNTVLIISKKSGDVYLDTTEATKEVLVGLLLSVTLIVWQSVKAPHYSIDDLRDKVINLVKAQLEKSHRSNTDQFSSTFARELASIYYDQYFGVVLLDIVLDRIIKMGSVCVALDPEQKFVPTAPSDRGVQMFKDTTPIATQVVHIKEQLKQFEFDADFRPWWWVSWSIKLMGILYPFVIPPAYFTVLGADIIYVGPIMFLFVGGLVLIDIFLGDPFYQPTNVQMGYVYGYLQDIPLKARRRYAVRFPPSSIPLISVQTPALLQNMQPGAMVTKQMQQQMQQQQTLVELANLRNGAIIERQRAAQQIIDSDFFEDVVDEWFLDGAPASYSKQH